MENLVDGQLVAGVAAGQAFPVKVGIFANLAYIEHKRVEAMNIPLRPLLRKPLRAN